MRILPYGTQTISLIDRIKVFNSLTSGWLTCGPEIKKFEESLADYVGAKHAIVVCNGTAALHLINLAVGYLKDEIGITSPNTFLASSNSIIYAGGIPVFSDIDPTTFNIDINKIDPETKNLKTIIPVHFAGLPVDVKNLKERFPTTAIIEDAAHALGSKFYDGKEWVKIGSCKYSLATIFSFHPVKHITTGEGGAITTNDDNLAEKLRILRTHGMVKSEGALDPWIYEMTELGYNYRITDFQCVLGLSQLKRIDAFIKKRRGIVAKYKEAFSNIEGISFAIEEEWQYNSYHLFVLLVDFTKFNLSRREFMKKLKDKGILTQVHYIPVYKQPYYREHFPHKESDFPNTEDYYNKTISIPLYPKMTNSDVSRVIKEIKNTLKIS